jgi:phospholipase C
MKDEGGGHSSIAVAAVVVLAASLAVGGLVGFPAAPSNDIATPLGPIHHVIEIMLENHAFDNFFGTFPGADGIPPNTSLPNGQGGSVAPYAIIGNSTASPPHDRGSELIDLDGGRMDGFVEAAAAVNASLAAVPMGHYDATELHGLWDLAREFTLCDEYFASVLGPTIPNRLYAIAGDSGGITGDSLPSQGLALLTIFDQLHASGVSWKYFYQPGGAYPPLPLWISPLRENPVEVQDVVALSTFLPEVAAGNLPAVAVVDPQNTPYSQQPPMSVTPGEDWTLGVIEAIEASPEWNSTAVFLTWDEGGGFYDHVRPPVLDSLGDGFRVPMLVVSPFSLGGGIDSTVYDHTSVLKFIDDNWGLPPLNVRVAEANDLGSALHLPAGSSELSRGDSNPIPDRSVPIWSERTVSVQVLVAWVVGKGTSFVGARRSLPR